MLAVTRAMRSSRCIEGCLWHLLRRQTCCRHLLTGGMFLLLQRDILFVGDITQSLYLWLQTTFLVVLK